MFFILKTIKPKEQLGISKTVKKGSLLSKLNFLPSKLLLCSFSCCMLLPEIVEYIQKDV